MVIENSENVWKPKFRLNKPCAIVRFDVQLSQKLMILFKTTEYIKWFESQTDKTQYIVQSRLKRIAEENHWGFINKFDGLIELKWTSGMRIYTTKVNDLTVVILLGGNKNGQGKDIKKAKKLLKEIKGSHFG